jgi:UV DNA damage endonuclease
METNYGYCCINMTLKEESNTYIGRSMIKRTFMGKGIAYASQLALANVRDLIEIVKWNEKKGIKLYRMSSDMFPWMSEYELKDLPDYNKISTLLKGVGNLASKYHLMYLHQLIQMLLQKQYETLINTVRLWI